MTPIGLNEVVDRGINVAVSRRLGIGDTGLSLLPELGINMVLPSDELLFHMGWRRYQRGVAQGAVAAQAPTVKLRNPLNSNILALVEAIVVTNNGGAAAVKIEFGYQLSPATDFANFPDLAMIRDSRQSAPANFVFSNCVVSHETNATPFVTGGMAFRIPANVPFSLPGAPWIVMPGFAVIVGQDVLNQALDVQIIWRERILNDQENVP